MGIAGSRVAIVGGSIAGCAAAIALRRVGCEVDVYERSSGELQDRGAGIAIPVPLRDELIEQGYLPKDYPSCSREQRRWVVADGTERGHTLWTNPGTAALSNWAILWRSLRAAAGAAGARYHDAAPVAAIDDRDDGATVTFADDRTSAVDVVVGADGYRSVAHRVVDQRTRPEYAGYVLWRGNFPEAQLRDAAPMADLDAGEAWLTVCFDGGHGVVYPIPDHAGASTAERRVNWAVYLPTPPGLEVDEPTSIAPGDVRAAWFRAFRAHLDRAVPPFYQSLFDSPHAEVSIQPVYDELAETYIGRRTFLIGDAGTVTRPHTGSGATKAMQDARTLERLGGEHDDWASLLAAYDVDRVDVGRSLVELGRRLGRDQVERTPPWSAMSPADFEAWTAGTLSGSRLYFYDEEDDPGPAGPDAAASVAAESGS